MVGLRKAGKGSRILSEAKPIALDEQVRLHPNEWSSVEARVIECSEAGFRAISDALVRVGFLVRLEVPGVGPVEAHVSWRRGNQFGATFVAPLDLTRTGFRPIKKEAVLARLLIERAAAQVKGSAVEERALRRQILEGLPVRRKGDGLYEPGRKPKRIF